jgi:hypothetical protein
VSLAATFAAISGSLSGLINMLRYASVHDTSLVAPASLFGLAESLVPMFLGFGVLTVAWFGVAVGLRRQA